MSRIGIPRIDYYIKSLSQMQEQNRVMTEEMEKNVLELQSWWEGITRLGFYQKIQEWHKLMETSNRLLGEIGEEMSRIQKKFDETDIQG